MVPPRGLCSVFWNFICFLPFFLGLLILGLIKGVIMFPIILVLMTVGIFGIILALWPVHCLFTCYCIIRFGLKFPQLLYHFHDYLFCRILALLVSYNGRTKLFGPFLKIVLCIFVVIIAIPWPVIGFACSVVAGAAYGLLGPLFATFEAVGEGRKHKFLHCIIDGIWGTLKGSFTIIRDVADVCYFSYFSVMDDLRHHGPPEGKSYEIRLLFLPISLVAGAVGATIVLPVITVIATVKSPYMLIKGWHRLFQDCIGREGPFLETICVPFAGLAILLWPLAVILALLGSIVSSVFLGAYTAVIVYQESSLWFGLCYIVASLSIYDEYSNDVLDMPEGSCFPRPSYRKNTSSLAPSRATSFSRTTSRNPPSRTSSLNIPMLELKPLELAGAFIKECRHHGENAISEEIITEKDIEAAKNSKDYSGGLSISLPAYCLFQVLLHSAKANSAGILLNDNTTEITTSNRPKDTIFDWFLNPLLIIRDQIKAKNLTLTEEKYLGKLVLFSGEPSRLRSSNTDPPPESDLRRAEFEAIARRLQGITKSISRFPTFRRRFQYAMKNILEELGTKNGDITVYNNTDPRSVPRSQSMLVQIFSQKSFKNRGNGHQEVPERDIEGR